MLSTDSQHLAGIKELRSKRSSDWFYVDWWLMNHCSWNCSYCHDVIKSGNIDLPNYNDCIRFVDEVVMFSKNKNKICYLNFTGGEVTEWADFSDLIEHSKKQGCRIKFRTNASSSRDQWIKLIENTDELTMEIHPEHTSVAHFLSLLGPAAEKGLSITVNVNMLRDRWEEMEELSQKIQQKYKSVLVFKKMLFQDPVFNTKPDDYKKPQQDELKNQYRDLVFVDKDQINETNYQTLVLEDNNQFKNWHCAAGVEQIVVDAWGKVYRGHCRFNGYLGSISDRVVWMEDPAICGIDYCRNSFDIQATKRLSE